MATDKKSFVLYCDLIHTVKKMPKEKAGELFLHILNYVNDLNPETDDLLIEVAFEPIKQQLKRDLKSWEGSKENKSIAGIKGNLKRWNLDLYEQVMSEKITIEEAQKIAESRKVSQPDVLPSQSIAKIAVNVNDTVTVNVNKSNIEERKLKFASLVKGFESDFEIQMLRDFYMYWSEHSPQGSKMRYEKEKVFDVKRRLDNWAKRSVRFDPPKEEIDPRVKHVQEQILKYSK